MTHAYQDPATAGAALAVYDRIAADVLPQLCAADQELVLLSIMARCQQSLETLGAPAPCAAELDTRDAPESWHTDLPDDELTVPGANPARIQ